MASPKFPARYVWVTLILLSSFCPHLGATTFPLPIPTRPATFPLSRPAKGGEVVAWGNNEHNQTTVPPGLTNIVAVSAKHNHTLALRADGTVVAWGDNSQFQSEVPVNATNIVAISAGYFHNLALKSDGTVVAWGNNGNGQSAVPQNLSRVVAIAAGQSHSLALRSDGTLVGWGGIGGTIPKVSYPPSLTFVLPTNVVAIAAGNQASCVLLSDDRALYWGTWGMGSDGPNFEQTQLLNGATVTMRGDERLFLRRDGIPHPSNDAPLNIKAAMLKSGEAAVTVALLGDGTVSAWGYNDNPGVNVPARLRGVIDIAVGSRHAVAVRLPTPPIPTTARASAQIVNGFIVGLSVIDGGEGYASPPRVTISGGGGSGAAATAQISKGIVTGFTMSSAGFGYVNSPTIEVEPPPFLPRLSIVTSRVGVTMQVVPGKRYQLEASNDLPNFGPVGAPFVADKDTFTQEFAVSETGQYFRITELP